MREARTHLFKSHLMRSAAIIVSASAAAVGGAHAQAVNTTPSNVNVLNLLSPFLGLNATSVGQATLQGNLDQAVATNNGANLTMQQLSISDKNLLGSAANSVTGLPGNYGVAANLAGGLPPQAPINGITPQQPVGGLGSQLGPIYVAGVANGLAGPLTNTVNLLTRAYNFAGADLGVAKNYFANGAASNPSTTPPGYVATPAVAPPGYTLPTFNGLPNTTNSVLDLAYGVTNTQPGQDVYGSSRPVQAAPNRINQFDPTSISGLTTNPSFPSGHTTYAYTDGLLLAMLVPQQYQSMLSRAAEYGNSRIVLGVHYPLDIIGSRALASYDLAQAFNNPLYLNNANTTGTAINLPALFNAAMPELNAYLSAQCGNTVAACATSAANTTNDPYVPSAANQALYQQRLTYGLPTLTYAQAPREAAPAGGPDASILLATIYGGNSAAATTIAPNGGLQGNLSTNTINQIIVNTEGTALAAFYGSPLSYWTRIDLYSAAGYFQNVAGVLTMASTDVLTTPTVTVGNTGVLVANGVIAGQTTVASGGVLAGVGTVGATTIAGGGALAPGVPAAGGTPAVGVLRVNGNLALNPGSTYLVNVTPASASRTAVTGTTTINGSTVAANFLGASAYSLAGSRQAILTSTGGVAGAFNNATLSGALANSVVPTLIALPNEIDLAFAPNTITSQLPSGTTRNERAVAAAIDASLATGAAPAEFVNLFGVSSSALPIAFDQLSGVLHADTHSLLIDDADAARNVILDRMRQIPYAGNGAGSALAAGGPALMYAEPATPHRLAGLSALKDEAPVVAPPPRTDLVLWAQGFGSWGSFDGNRNAPQADRDFGGFLSGADIGVGDAWRVGLAGGYSHSTLRTTATSGAADVDTAHVALYGAASYGAVNLRVGGAYSFSSLDTTRTVTFPFGSALAASYDAGVGQAFGEIGYGLTLGQFAFEPFAGLAYVHLSTDSFTETGGLGSLSGAGTDVDLGYSTLGLRLATNVAIGNGLTLTPRAMAAWSHAFDDVTPTQALLFNAGGASFLIAGTPIARDAALVEAGADLKISPQASVGLSYVGQLSSNVTEHGVKGNFTYRW